MPTYHITIVVETDLETAESLRERIEEAVDSMTSDYAVHQPIQNRGVFMGED